MSHTPGPWEVWTEHLSVFAGPLTENTPAVVAGYRSHVADCEDAYDDGEIGWEEAQANARLVAASPDLLEACEAMLRVEAIWLPPFENSADDEGETETLHLMYDNLKAAIAKARTAPPAAREVEA